LHSRDAPIFPGTAGDREFWGHVARQLRCERSTGLHLAKRMTHAEPQVIRGGTHNLAQEQPHAVASVVEDYLRGGFNAQQGGSPASSLTGPRLADFGAASGVARTTTLRGTGRLDDRSAAHHRSERDCPEGSLIVGRFVTGTHPGVIGVVFSGARTVAAGCCR